MEVINIRPPATMYTEDMNSGKYKPVLITNTLMTGGGYGQPKSILVQYTYDDCGMTLGSKEVAPTDYLTFLTEEEVLMLNGHLHLTDFIHKSQFDQNGTWSGKGVQIQKLPEDHPIVQKVEETEYDRTFTGRIKGLKWKDIPEKFHQIVKQRQAQAGTTPDLDRFVKPGGAESGGFAWSLSSEGYTYWNLISHGQYDEAEEYFLRTGGRNGFNPNFTSDITVKLEDGSEVIIPAIPDKEYELVPEVSEQVIDRSPTYTEEEMQKATRAAWEAGIQHHIYFNASPISPPAPSWEDWYPEFIKFLNRQRK